MNNVDRKQLTEFVEELAGSCLLRRLADSGDAEALYLKGRLATLRKDYAEAEQNLLAAASQAHLDAQYALARLYDLGYGDEPDAPGVALMWYEAPANRGTGAVSTG